MNEYSSLPCAQWQEKLAVLPPEALSSADQEALETHLRSCPACTSVYSQYHELSTALSNLSSDLLPPGLPPRLLQHWQETGRVSSNDSRLNKRPRRITQKRSSTRVPTRRLIAASILVVSLIISIAIVFGSWINNWSLLAGGKSGGPTGVINPLGPELVIFASSISYNQALRLVTDMGLQPSLDCPPYAGHYTPGNQLQPQPIWQPVGQRETFSETHQIWVYPTFSAPLDWRLRLVKIPGVHFGTSHVLICLHVIYGTPPPGVIMPLSSAQAGIYVRIAFARSQTYDAALYTVSDLGLGLVNYCYEQAEVAAGRGPQPSWQFTGEEQQFAGTHTLIVETGTRVTSSLWQTQLRANPDVASIEVPYTTTCLAK
jgi:hypothetical protein